MMRTPPGNTQDDCAEKPSIQLRWGKNKATVGEPINTTPLGEDKATRWGVIKQLATDKSKIAGDIPINPQVG